MWQSKKQKFFPEIKNLLLEMLALDRLELIFRNNLNLSIRSF
jgi:hypothetical protein